MRQAILVGFMLLLASGCATSNERLARLFDDYWEDRLRHEPVFATSTGDHRYDDRLSDLSIEAHSARLVRQKAYLDRLHGIPRSELSPQGRANRDIFERILEDSVADAASHRHLFPLNQLGGPHLTLPMLQISHPFRTENDWHNYARRLAAFPQQIEQIIACLQQGMNTGYVAAKVNIEPVVSQMEELIATDPAQSAFCAPLSKMPADIGSSAQHHIRESLLSTVSESVFPAYERLLSFVRDDYLPACRQDVGIHALPEGKRIYALRARIETTTNLTPEEIHRIGLDEVTRLRREMDQVRRELNYEGDLDSFIAHLRASPEFFARTGAELMARCDAIMRRAQAALPQLFGRLPETPIEMKEIEPYRAANAPIAYYDGAPEDGSRPAYYYINTYEPARRPLYSLEALSYHEAVPGHHLQFALDRENDNLPHFRRYARFTAYVEGWALYAESLGEQMGGYQDLLSRFGRLNFNMWRACRLVVDTGMHYYGWTREQAIEYMLKNTALARINVEAEIDRYIAWPGQALAYKIGEITIIRLRREAQRRLGKRFDLRAFHDELLREGAMPLSVLEDRMQAWIARECPPVYDRDG